VVVVVLQCAIYGNFSAPKAQEIVVSRGHTLELIRPADNGRLQVRQADRQTAGTLAGRRDGSAADSRQAAPTGTDTLAGR
jgi:hypothetical protein